MSRSPVTHGLFFHPTLEWRLPATEMKQQMTSVTKREQHNHLGGKTLCRNTLCFPSTTHCGDLSLVVIWL